MRGSILTIGILAFTCLLFGACDDQEGAKCGNGKIEGDEQCDVNLGGATCRDLGHDRGLLACNHDCTYDESGCTDCGNNTVEEGESCDGTDLADKTCQDLGHTGGDLACAENCTFDDSACHDWLPMTLVIKGYSEAAGEDVPLEGATVALDPPTGERIEQVTDAEGKTTFSDIDWNAGTTTLTIHKDGYTMFTETGSIKAEYIQEEVTLTLPSLTPSQQTSVVLSGSIVGEMDPTRNFFVNAVRTKVATEWQGTGDQSFRIRVPYNQPFTVQATETEFEYLPSGQGYSMPIYQTLKKDFDALSADTSGAVLDFSVDSVQTYTEDVWVSLPQRADSPVRAGFPYCLVAEGNSIYTIGWSTHIDISADGNQLDASLLWTQPAWAEDVLTFCGMTDQGGWLSIAYADGYPQPGEVTPLLDVPRWISPANPSMAHPLYDPLEWELFDPGVSIQMNIFRGDQLVWFVFMDQDTETVTLPAPPSSVNPVTFLGTAPLRSQMYAFTVNEAGDRATALSLAPAILLTPPVLKSP